jgi:hypothetical protein
MYRFTKSESKRESSPSASFSIYKFKHGRALVRYESTLLLREYVILTSMYITSYFYDRIILPDTHEESSTRPSIINLRRWELRYSSSSFVERSVILRVVLETELMTSNRASRPCCLIFSTCSRAVRTFFHPDRYCSSVFSMF